MYKVVVVEDEEIARKGIIFTINWEALNCMIAGEAANGEEGAAVIRRLSPDIIVTDLKMPRMDGVEMIQMLRCEGNRAKFIILTAYGDFKYAQSAVKLGVSDYLLKPLKDGDLEQAVTRIIAQLEERDQIRQKEEEETPVFRFNAGRKAKNKYVEQAIKYICEHYKEDINISTVAEQLQISEGYLSRVFKKETDYTFTTYLSHYRMKVAMELLKEGKLKVYEVADSVGYSDTAYFSAQFKKVVGMGQVEAALNRYLMAMDKFYKEHQLTPSDQFKELYHLVGTSHLEEPKSFEDIAAELSEPEIPTEKQTENRFGAYECEYSVFKRLFWLERRAVARSGESVYLCLLSIERPDGRKMKADVLGRAAERMKMVIQGSLRASDIFSRYSVSQYVVLIPAATYENCEAVMERITRAFNKGYVRKDVAAVSRITAVLPADRECS